MFDRSFIDFSGVTASDVQQIFELAKSFEQGTQQKVFGGLAYLFLEPSTRTRMSFEQAAFRLGLSVSLIDGVNGTSLEKDETFEDTVLNVAAMNPRLIVIRCSGSESLASIVSKIQIPVINAGWGTIAHPTQALLDIYTLLRRGKKIDQQKILFVGDVKHSRVFSSHLQLSKILGYEIGICGPKEWQIENNEIKFFDQLQAGLSWCHVVMGLRIQKERHEHQSSYDFTSYQLNPDSLKFLRSESLLMHPGPINWGVEFSEEVKSDHRSVVLEQVSNGVYMRQALISHFLSGVT